MIVELASTHSLKAFGGTRREPAGKCRLSDATPGRRGVHAAMRAPAARGLQCGVAAELARAKISLTPRPCRRTSVAVGKFESGETAQRMGSAASCLSNAIAGCWA